MSALQQQERGESTARNQRLAACGAAIVAIHLVIGPCSSHSQCSTQLTRRSALLDELFGNERSDVGGAVRASSNGPRNN